MEACPDVQAALSKLVNSHNTLLKRLAKGFSYAHPEALITTFDFFAIFQDQVASATASGINIDSPCYPIPFIGEFQPLTEHPAPCSDPENFLFWDQLHHWMGTRACWSIVGRAATGLGFESERRYLRLELRA